ncbi:lysozyme inhibitor LprI family protein [Marinobacter sp. JSM 1782161]|uniref:lysozyme inhibitor LprI family protein n=1 Tax=Marinobacter sp. JSM 1782161 TaxID=2685906 RepID=UPI001403D588|nr:lysozyme inhibitor LprI family protein [Marinobacter sp. JSM 1782161]
MRLLIALMMMVYAGLTLAADDDCENPLTTMDMTRCASMELESANEEMKQYLQAALDRYDEAPSNHRLINAAQETWDEYRTKHCDSLFHVWSDSTLGSVKFAQCKTRLTRARTHEIWRSFLTRDDDSEPVLPEPQ